MPWIASSLGLAGVIFFFSSRRRHTRLQGDWSSDVCSSDLAVHQVLRARRGDEAGDVVRLGQSLAVQDILEIGRASCREKSVDLGGRRIIKKKKKNNEGMCGNIAIMRMRDSVSEVECDWAIC